jgi:hypothetical protein
MLLLLLLAAPEAASRQLREAVRIMSARESRFWSLALDLLAQGSE